MNKTVTVNIGGMVFHIEEQAYDKLKRYLEAIRGYFTSSEGRDEIIQDIESRIAEMFSERIGIARQVVVEADVEYMIDTMGRPDQVAGETDDDTTNSANTSNQTNERGPHRRLYRDPEDKVIGGVCSGISYYVGIEPIWMRLIFAIAFFVFGSGFLIYMLLMVIIPKAKTTAEKLEMKGQPVNIDNIKKTIQDEVDDIKSRLDGSKAPFSRGTGTISNFFEALGEILIGAVRIIAKIAGGFLMVILTVLLIALFVGVLSVTGIIGNAQMPVLMTESFLSNTQLTFSVIALILVIGIPIITIFYTLARLLFNIKSEHRILNYAAKTLWVAGIIIAIFLVISISNNFRRKEQQRIDIPIAQPTNKTLYLSLLSDANSKDYHFESDDIINVSDIFSTINNDDTFRINNVSLDVLRAEGDKFELVKIVSANGSDRKEAELNLRNIDYNLLQEDSILKFGHQFHLSKGMLFRNQKIKLILKVPLGGSVHFSHDIDEIIYDIKNVTNTYDGEMVDKTWTMTEDGLKCIGCDLDESTQEKSTSNVRINGKEININSKSREDTINWDNKDVKIHINKDGVMIDAKEK